MEYTWQLSLAVELFSEDEEGKRLHYICWEPHDVSEYVHEAQERWDQIRRVLLCDRTKRESDYYIKHLTPTGRSMMLQEKMNANDLTSYPN